MSVLDRHAQAQMLGNRLGKNRRRLGDWARGAGVSCYRVYDRDIPEVPVAIDDYEGRLVVHDFRRAGAELDAQGDAWIDAMAAAAQDALAAGEVHVKRRERMAGRRDSGRQYGRLGDGGAWHEVGEGGHRFLVNLSDYLDTGLFLDHRMTRARVAAEVAGRRVLNLFCYTGAFTVYAAGGGAASSTSVDLSATYLDWAAENLARNRIDAGRHALVRSDVRRFLDDAGGRGERWDLAVVDPPTFSNSKAMDYVWDVQRDHGELLAAVAAVLAPGGTLWFSTNRRRFSLERDALPAGASIDDLTAATSPPDFRDRAHVTYRIDLPSAASRPASPAARPAAPAPPPRRGGRTPRARGG